MSFIMEKEKTLKQYAKECSDNCKKLFSTKNSSRLWTKPEIIDFFANLPLDQPAKQMEQLLAGAIDLRKKKILIIGGGTGGLGRYVALKHPEVKITEIDLSQAMVDKANEMAINQKISDRFLSKKMDILSNTFQNKEFDFVLAYGVFRYIDQEDWPRAIGEVKRISKLGAIISEGKAKDVIYGLRDLVDPGQKVEEVEMPMFRISLFYILQQLYESDKVFRQKVDNESYQNINKTISNLAGEDIGVFYKLQIQP